MKRILPFIITLLAVTPLLNAAETAVTPQTGTGQPITDSFLKNLKGFLKDASPALEKKVDTAIAMFSTQSNSLDRHANNVSLKLVGAGLAIVSLGSLLKSVDLYSQAHVEKEAAKKQSLTTRFKWMLGAGLTGLAAGMLTIFNSSRITNFFSPSK